MNIAVMVSGGGTNLQALLDAAQEPDFPATVVLVGCNRADAAAIARAEVARVPVCLADRDAYTRRAERQRRLLEAIRCSAADLVVLAGFDEVLLPEFVAAYGGRM